MGVARIWISIICETSWTTWHNNTPGNSVEVYYQGSRVFRYDSGYSNWEEKIPLTGNGLFNIYSCSKVATVTAGMQSLEKGDILLTDPLYAYMPAFREMHVQDKDGNLKKNNPADFDWRFVFHARGVPL